jgi:hypothetical protein
MSKVGVAALMATAALTAVSASPAQAACPGQPYNRPNGEGSATKSSGQTAWIRSGPSSSCSSFTTLAAGVTFWIHCDYFNAAGNKWYFGRIAGTQSMGWVYSMNVTWHPGDENGDGYTTPLECYDD